MSICTSNAFDIYEGLKYNFLYNNDIDCIHMLLDLYDIEDNIRNIYPKYVSIKIIRNYIYRFLRKRPGNHMIAMNLGELIHEDINRLELFLYLEGYKQGYHNVKMANMLEGLTLKNNSLEKLYSLKYLYHFEYRNEEILKLKERINQELEGENRRRLIFYNTVKDYISDVIRPKIFSLNKHLDKQLKIDYQSSTGNIREDETLLTKNDLLGIYKQTFKIIFNNGLKIYKDAYWYGINDRVLKRYR